MASQKDFVSDYQPGDRITVVLSGGTLIWSGVLAEIGERRIRLRMQDGTVRSIAYEGIIADYLQAETVPEALPEEMEAEVPMETEIPVQEKELTEEEKKLILLRDAALAVRDAVYEWEFDPASLREQVRLSPNTEEKRLMTALAENLESADAAEDYETIDKIVAAGLSLLEKAPDNTALHRLVGEAALLAEDYDLAEESLYASENYAEAFYAASLRPAADKMAEDGACHLLYDRKKVPDVVRCFVRMAADADDLSVFGRFLENERGNEPLLRAQCLAYLLLRKKIVPELPEDELTAPENLGVLEAAFREAYPFPENNQLEMMETEEKEEEVPEEEPVTLNYDQIEEEPAPEEPSAPVPTRTGLEGVIFSFKPEQKIGFIRAEDTDWFFHLNHIIDEDLQKMLEEDPAAQYLIYFDVGQNYRGDCAINVRLRDKNNPKEKEDPALLVEHHGIITRYYPFYSNGQITEGENVYNFRAAFITDPTLKNYCEIFQDVVQRQFAVVFRLKKLKDGKLVATDIQLETPFTEGEMKLIQQAT